jgi:hypothetical protein
MNCEQCRELLAGYVEDLLEPQQSEMVMQHLQSCRGCQAELEQTMTLRNRLVKSCTNLKGRDIEIAVMDKIVRQQAFELRKTSENKQSMNFWRTVMKNRIAHLAAAAIIIIAVLVGVYFFTGKTPTATCCAWGDIIRPIMDANTAEFDIIIGEEGKSPLIHDMVMGSKIRRTMEGMEGVSVIDLRTMRILTLDPENKKATYVDLKGLPQMPNYLVQVKEVIKMLQNVPGFVVEELGQHEIDGQFLYGFKAKHPQVTIVIYVDPVTALPVRIEQEGGQMKVICKNMRFDVPMDETQFSMDAPEDYKIKSKELDLLGSTEEDFIEGLRIQAEVLNDGVFPDDVSIEYVVKTAVELKDKFEKLKMTDDEKTALGMKYQKGLMFIRFFKGEGKWYYAGKGVKLGDADTAIFWYRPAGMAKYHVIYGDLTVEDVNKENLPQPLEEESDESIGNRDFAGIQDDQWHITASGQVEAHAHLRITRAPEDTSVMTIAVPYSEASIVSVTLDGSQVPFNKSKWMRRYDVNLPVEKIDAGLTDINIVWTMPLDRLEKASYGYRAELAGLIPLSSYSLTIILDEGCGYVFSDEFSEVPSKPTLLVFSDTVSEPKTYFGSCGIPVKPSNQK